MIYILIFVFVLLFVRTLGFHLQQWQIREYRADRLFDHIFYTKEGRKKLWNLWFFPGFFPRPKVSGRLLLILFFWVLFCVFLFHQFYPFDLLYRDIVGESVRWEYLLLLVILFERTLFLTVSFGVFLSAIPADIIKQRLFNRAKRIIDYYEEHNPELVRIGITGSYGKSSTKEILVHLLIQQFGAENVLYNPRNENNEVAIARLIVQSREFFTHETESPKFMVIEMGAYKKGEIAKMCDFVQPHVSLLTGVNNQHISLFGSQRNIQEAKFELAERTRDTVFFNAESPLLAEIFNDQDIRASKIPISRNLVTDIEAHPDRTEFTVFGQRMVLPWMGEFFVLNALLCLELVRELGMDPADMAFSLSSLPPLDRALHVKTLSSGATLISDPYSANVDGVLQAIDQMRRFSGRKIFVGIPLIELGNTACESHKIIFQRLKDIDAEVFWLKSDFADVGQLVCGDRFHGHNLDRLRAFFPQLKKEDVILLESRLPKGILDEMK
jgi:UDP-N-acetylmuramoyl-tripeptide--D-alanyl-D-alanine ligase